MLSLQGACYSCDSHCIIVLQTILIAFTLDCDSLDKISIVVINAILAADWQHYYSGCFV